MSIVPAKCTSCGANLTVDSSKDAAICEYCNTPYIVEKAINNFHLSGKTNISINSATLNIQGLPSIDNLLKRAVEFEHLQEIELALEYYNRILDIDADNVVARHAILRLDNKVLAEIPITGSFVKGTLTLNRNELVYTSNWKKETYQASAISSVNRFVARLTIHLTTRRQPLEFAVGSPKDAKTMEIAINNLIARRR